MYLLGVDSLGVIQPRIPLMDGGFIGRIPNDVIQAFAWSERTLIRRSLLSRATY